MSNSKKTWACSLSMGTNQIKRGFSTVLTSSRYKYHPPRWYLYNKVESYAVLLYGIICRLLPVWLALVSKNFLTQSTFNNTSFRA